MPAGLHSQTSDALTAENDGPVQVHEDLKNTYLDLVEAVLINTIYGDAPQKGSRWRARPFLWEARWIGRDLPSRAHSMIGAARMRNLRMLAERALREGIPGDFIETGVWRGGACIYMRAILKAWGVVDRTVWVADSFEGLPPPDPRHRADRGDKHHKMDALAVSRSEVEANFALYGLLDDQVRFLEGWFAETLPSAPINELALLRLDGDMYGSTWDALSALYDRVAAGGFVIIDDFGAVPACAEATKDFLADRALAPTLHEIDWTGVWFQKDGPHTPQ